MGGSRPSLPKLSSTKPQDWGQGLLKATRPWQSAGPLRPPLPEAASLCPARHLGSGDPYPLALTLPPPFGVPPCLSVLSSRADPLGSPRSGLQRAPRAAALGQGRVLLPATPHHPTCRTNNKPGSSSTCCCPSLGWEGGGGWVGVHPGPLPSLPPSPHQSPDEPSWWVPNPSTRPQAPLPEGLPHKF